MPFYYINNSVTVTNKINIIYNIVVTHSSLVKRGESIFEAIFKQYIQYACADKSKDGKNGAMHTSTIWHLNMNKK